MHLFFGRLLHQIRINKATSANTRAAVVVVVVVADGAVIA